MEKGSSPLSCRCTFLRRGHSACFYLADHTALPRLPDFCLSLLWVPFPVSNLISAQFLGKPGEECSSFIFCNLLESISSSYTNELQVLFPACALSLTVSVSQINNKIIFKSKNK